MCKWEGGDWEEGLKIIDKTIIFLKFYVKVILFSLILVTEDPALLAKQDALRDFDKELWYLASAAFGPMGYLLQQLYLLRHRDTELLVKALNSFINMR